jgi:ribonuclease BN (tRNA processing enzyme)
LELGSASLLLDCGPGTLHGLAQHGIDWARVSHVVISHYHNDHVGDLAALLFAMKQPGAPPRSRPLCLVGPAGFRAFLERLAAALGSHVLEPGFEVLVYEVGPTAPYEDPDEDPDGGFAVEARPTPHTEESLAYRIGSATTTVGYTGDTGPSDEVARFLSDCQVLLAECALTDPPTMERHLSPRLVVDLARVARPGLLVLTHVYPGQTPEEAAATVAAGYDGPVVAARDGMRIVLGSTGPVVDPNPAAT